MAYEMGLPSNVIKSFDLTIDGDKLTNGQVVSLKIKWNIDNFKIIGKLIFKDISNLVENGPIRGDNTFVMALTDFDDAVSTQTFKVTGVSYTRSPEGITLTVLELVDPITVASTQMFNEMSWASEHMIGIVDHVETMKPLLVGKKKDFCPPPPPHKNFCMPLHVPFNVVSHWLAKNANVMWYQTRKDFVIQPIKELFGRGKKGDKFRHKTPNPDYRRKVYEFGSNFGNLISANAFQATGKVASFDPANKHSKWTDNDFKGALGKLSSKGTTDLDLTATTAKHFYKTDYHIKENVDFMWMKNSYKGITLEILVPGQFDTNIGDIVELDFVNHTKITEPEANINGEWLIIECIDMIVPPDFVQRLTLARAKFSK